MNFPFATETIGSTGLYGDDTSVLNSFVHNLAAKMGVSPEEAFLKFPVKAGVGDEFLDRYFRDSYKGNKPSSRGGTVFRTDLSSGDDYAVVGLTQAQTPETLGHESAHVYDYLLGNLKPDGGFRERVKAQPKYFAEKDPTKRWMINPEAYNKELHASVTGYGNRDDYELKAMQDSWDRAARTWSPEYVKSGADPLQVRADKNLPKVASPGLYGSQTKNRELMFNQAKHNRSNEAVRNKWLNDPANDKFGDLKGVLSSTVANAMVNKGHDNAVNTMRGSAEQLRRSANAQGYNPETPKLLQMEKDVRYFNSPAERWARYFGKSLDDVVVNNYMGSGSHPDADEVVKNLNKLLFK